jgi:hypothetical protein
MKMMPEANATNPAFMGDHSLRIQKTTAMRSRL